MSATVRRDHVVDFVVGNRRPFAVHLDFVMVADHAALRWATVHEVTAGAFAVVSVELQIKVFMPPIMANPVISFLRRRADTKERRDDAALANAAHPPIRNSVEADRHCRLRERLAGLEPRPE